MGWGFSARGALRWSILLLGIGLAIVYVWSAAFSAWVAGGPPTPVPAAWRHHAFAQLCIAATVLLFALAIFRTLKPGLRPDRLVWAFVLLGGTSMFAPAAVEFVDVDRCLDSGGRWSKKAYTCVRRDLPCEGSEATLGCLMLNRQELYAADYERFWAIAHAAAATARKCSSIGSVAEFLDAGGRPTGSAEFDEFLAGEMERLCVEAPECFRRAVSSLGSDTRAALAKRLDAPMFEEPERIARANCLGVAP